LGEEPNVMIEKPVFLFFAFAKIKTLVIE
jgi:hypothetical protein